MKSTCYRPTCPNPKIKPSHKFCSQSCAGKYSWEISERASKYPMNRECRGCGEDFLISTCNEARKVFCNHSCAARYNNKLKGTQDSKCLVCDSIVYKSKHSLCSSCYYHKQHVESYENLSERTMGELRGKHIKGQTPRTDIIRAMARNIIKWSCVPLECMVCGYDDYVEIAHVKPIKEFEDDRLASEPNSLDNLSILCPNHHKQLDKTGTLHEEDTPRLSQIISFIPASRDRFELSARIELA